jgi:hypothetical protein
LFNGTNSKVASTDSDPVALIEVFTKCGTRVLDLHAPVKRRKLTMRKNEMKFSPALKGIKIHTRKLEKQWLMSKLSIDRELYNKSGNSYIHQLRKAKNAATRRKLKDPGLTPRQLWRILVDTTVGSLKCATKTNIYSDMSADECKIKAQCFSRYFTDKVNTINAQRDHHRSYITLDISGQSKHIMYEFKPTSPKEIAFYLKRLSSHKGSLADPVLTSLLNKNDHICELLSNIYNASFKSECFPQNLKRAIITLILKKPDLDSTDEKNFRPVSSLPTIGKLLEKIAADRLMHHLQKVGFLHHNQSAYRLSYSTETALLKVISDWRCAIDRGNSICVASLDTVSHRLLHSKLVQAGVLGRRLKWFSSYLEDRSASIRINDAMSDYMFLKSGVPQGSVLGPCLFNCYMADLCWQLDRRHGSSGIKFHIYADDVLIYFEFDKGSTDTAIETMKSALKFIDGWMKSNSLLLNLSKTELIICHGKRGDTSKLNGTSINIGSLSVKILCNLAINKGIPIELEAELTEVPNTAPAHGFKLG